MTLASAAFDVVAASRPNPAIKDAGMCVGLGLFVAALIVGLMYVTAKKRGQAMDEAFYQKLWMFGVFGMLCGYFSMSIAIKSNPEVFRGKPPLSDQQIQSINKNPVVRMPQSGSQTSSERPPRTPAQEAEIRARQEARREQAEMEREARLAQRQADRGEAQVEQSAELSRKQADMNYLNSLSIQELQQVLEARRLVKDEATKSMRELNASDSTATPEERRAASQRFSLAVGDFMAASKAFTQKNIEHRRQKR